MKTARIPIFKRVILGLLQHIAAALIFVFIAAILFNSFLTVNTMSGQKTYYLNPLSQRTSFEESEVFEDMFQNAVRDVIRLAVIRDQLEVNGTFEPKKQIDVTKFLQTYGAPNIDYGEATAVYELEDLIKWERYGLEYKSRVMSLSDFVNYYGNACVIKNFGLDGSGNLYFRGYIREEDDRSEDLINRIKSKMEKYTEAQLEDMAFSYILGRVENGITMTREDDGNLTVYINTLTCNRFQTVDHKIQLYDIAKGWDEFMRLQSNVALVCRQLSENYELYQNCIGLYEEGNSNLKYVVRMKTHDKKKVTYTNINSFSKMDEKTITENFEEYRRYLIYYPTSLEIMGNTSFTEGEIFDHLRTSRYPYLDDVYIWIAMDSTYAGKGDAFYYANAVFERIVPYVTGIITALAFLVLLWMVIGIYMTVTAGVVYREDGTMDHYLNQFDRMWTEFLLILAGLAGYGAYLGFQYLYQIADEIYSTKIEKGEQAVKGLLTPYGTYALFGFVLSILLALIGYSFVRRIKSGNLYKDSMIHAFVKAIYRFFGFMMGHQNSVISVLLPYNLFLLLNIFAIVGAYSIAFYPVKILILIGIISFDTVVGMLLFRNNADHNDIVEGIGRIRSGEVEYKLDTSKLSGMNKNLAEAVNNIGEGIDNAVKTSMKDERLKTDLITNVSHDIKTPLTSIINYVDLLKRQNITQEPAKGYIDILENKALRLKDLTDDLVEASKISSGNIVLNLEVLNLGELMKQTIGELSDKLEEHNLKLVADISSDHALVYCDSRRMWRVMENLFNNICKYAMEGTRVYTEIGVEDEKVFLRLKNVSKAQMNIHADELTERFIRGDSSRSTEGSGLGLFIAKSLTNAQGGNFEIQLDGDLFKVNIDFPLYHEPPKEEPAKEEQDKEETAREKTSKEQHVNGQSSKEQRS